MARRCHRAGRRCAVPRPREAQRPRADLLDGLRITACEPGAEFGFEVLAGKRPVNTWHYRFDAADGGTDVTESFRLPATTATRIYWALAGWARGRTNRANMRSTLRRIKAVVESGEG